VSTKSALMAILDGPHPASVNETARLEYEKFSNAAYLHLLPTCECEGTHGKTVASLVASVDNGTDLEVCPACLVRTNGDPDTERGTWARELRYVLTTYVHRDAAADLHAPLAADVDAISSRAGNLLTLAGMFTVDTAELYFERTRSIAKWRHAHLRDVACQVWDDGKALFEEAAAKGLGSLGLIGLEPPTADRWAIVGKGRGFWLKVAPRNGFETSYVAALLEGPKLAQTDDWFVTPVTWGDSAERQPWHLTLPARPDVPAQVLETALDLWSGRRPRDLERLIESVSAATTT
jgi:hypothetical protein